MNKLTIIIAGILGYVLFFCLILFRKKIKGIFRRTDKYLIPVKIALVSALVTAAAFAVWSIGLSMTSTFGPGIFGLIVILPAAVLVGTGGFLILWSIITLCVFFSPKYRSTIPKRKLFIFTILALAIVILGYTSFCVYDFLPRKILLYKTKSPQISQANLSEIYAKAMEENDIEILQRIAKNTQTSVKILEDIYASYQQYSQSNEYYPIFHSLAGNKNTPEKILKELAKSKEESVRSSVARNPNTPTEVLRALAKDEKFLVRTSIADNRNTPRDVLVKLSSDSHPLVSAHARSRLPEAALSK